MAVDLEALALRSIEQYAAFKVELDSIKETLKEMHRKNEAKEEKFSIACDNLARVNEKLQIFADDKIIIHKRIDEVKAAVNTLADAVRDATESMIDHQDDHCDECQNITELNKLRAQIDNPPLPEVRGLVTTPWGINWLRFITSQYGKIWTYLVTAGTILSFITHRDSVNELLIALHFK